MPENALASEWVERLPGLETLWFLTHGDPCVRIAILDGPTNPSVLRQAGADSDYAVRHGTHIHSIIAGTIDAVVPGLAPDCSVISLPIFAPAGESVSRSCSQKELATAIGKALELNCNIINISAS